jgi:hypothetical protein
MDFMTNLQSEKPALQEPGISTRNPVRFSLVCQSCKGLQLCELADFLLIAVVTSRLRSLTAKSKGLQRQMGEQMTQDCNRATTFGLMQKEEPPRHQAACIP